MFSTPTRKAYPSDVSDEEWSLIAPYITRMTETAQQREYPMRELLNDQVTAKLAPALAVGCTVVLKRSEVAPLSTILLMEILHDAGVPKGVVNLVNGDGATVGEAISAHPDIDMVSFTGSTRAGILVAKAAADSVKRVAQ